MTAASAAVKPSAHSTAGDTKTRNSGLWFMTGSRTGRSVGGAPVTPSVHDVLGEPLAPFRGLLGAQLVIDDDRLLVPLVGRREHSRQLGDGGIDLGIEHH